MDFKSQICTTIEQSKRLLELGLKPETADMYYTNASLPFNKENFHLVCMNYFDIGKSNGVPQICRFSFIPSWSLHRLIEIGNFVNVGFLNIDKMFDCCIQMLEGQIRGGVINQNYINI